MTVMTVMGAFAAADTPAAGFSEAFLAPSPAGWSVADYAFSHPGFDTDWSRERLGWNQGLELGLVPRRGPGNRFSGAAIRRLNKSHYGRYEITLQPGRGEGVVTGFFLYTGRYYGTRHDEIDIEFLGRDTRRLQAAWFVDGKMQSRWLDLGYDAALAPRRYVFEWHPDEIRWYAGDRLLLRIGGEEAALPQLPGHLFINLWAADPSLAAWAGHAAADTRARARVTAVGFTPLAPRAAGQPKRAMPGAAAKTATRAPAVPPSGE